MNRLGLIGYPIAHSLSPKLFKAGYPNSGTFSYDLIEEEDFEKAFASFISDFLAVNVTAPFKEKALQSADWKSREAESAGAANILVKENGLIRAYNSDYLAVKYILSYYPSNSRILVAGLGGAGKAAAAASSDSGFITSVWNRSEIRCLGFKEIHPEVNIVPDSSIVKEINNSDLLIYTVPTKVYWIESVNFSGLKVLEANYKDPCLAGLCPADHYISGKIWLAEQAVHGFAYMTKMIPNGQNIREIIDL